LEAVGEEVTFIQSVRSDQFKKVDFTFFSGDQEHHRQGWEKARSVAESILDLILRFGRASIGRAHARPGSNVSLAGSAIGVAGPVPSSSWLIPPHRAGVAVSPRTTSRKAEPRCATVFEPSLSAAARALMNAGAVGQPALIPGTAQEVFDARIGFNLIRRYGEKPFRICIPSSAGNCLDITPTLPEGQHSSSGASCRLQFSNGYSL